MAERQRHGFNFENWVRHEFFATSNSSYGGKWNQSPKPADPYPDLYKSIKTAKWRSSVYLADAIRQFQIDEDFVLIVAFWERDSRGERRWVSVVATQVARDLWRDLWGNISIEQLRALDTLIKDQSLSVQDVRWAAHALKRRIHEQSQSIIRLHPKIDTGVQRRLQCSLRFSDFFRLIARTQPQSSDKPQLWGKEIPVPFD